MYVESAFAFTHLRRTDLDALMLAVQRGDTDGGGGL